MKTCSYCHFTNNFFNFNYSRISTGEYFLSHSSCFYLHLLAYFLYVHISFRPIAALSWYVPPWLSTVLPISTLALTKMLQKHLGAYWWKYGMLLSHLNYMTPSRPFSDLYLPSLTLTISSLRSLSETQLFFHWIRPHILKNSGWSWRFLFLHNNLSWLHSWVLILLNSLSPIVTLEGNVQGVKGCWLNIVYNKNLGCWYIKVSIN